MRTPLPLLLLIATPLLAAPQGPPYADKKRNLEKQQEAARAARDAARAGGTPEQFIAWLADDSAHVRDAVFAVLVEKKDEALLKKLESQLGHKDELVAASIAELFALTKYAAGRAALEKAALSGPEAVALEAVWALEALADAEAASALRKAFDKRKEPRLRGDALLALAAVDAETAKKELPAALKDKQPVVRMAALLALLRLDPPAAIGAAVDEIGGDPAPASERAADARLLSCALEVLRAWTARSAHRELCARAIEAMLGRLKREEGLSKHLVAFTLEDLTREQGLGEDVALWEGWWAAQKERWTPADKAPPEEKGKRPARGKGKEPEPEKPGRVETGNQGGTRVRFHGVPVRSKRLMFIQDLSGGMNNPLDKDEAGGPSKMRFAKDETVRVLKELPDDTWANVLFFATEWYRAGERLLPLGKVRPSLIEFVGKQETPDTSAAQNRHKGRSNLFDTLLTALADPEIDTIFFVSEGGPTEGRFVDEGRFVRHFERFNRYQRVQVHGFLVSNSTDGERFLRKLADLSGAEFHDLPSIRKAEKEKK